MNSYNKSENKINELQILEQNLQNFLMQKQAFQLELNEISNALEELRISGDEVYKIFGNSMFKTDKKRLLKELEEKRKHLEIRVSSIEKQEEIIAEKIKNIQQELKFTSKNKSPKQ